MRYRIVRAAELDQLRDDQAELETVRADLAAARSEVEIVTDSAIRADAVADDLLRRLARAHADTIAAEREMAQQFAGLQAVIRQVTAERDDARKAVRQEYGDVIEQMRADLAQLRADASDTETGESMRAAIAYGVLGRMINEVRAQDEKGELRPPFDVVALVLGFDTDATPQNGGARCTPSEAVSN
ncbi:hypothetical protein [Streptomyces fradiae]|uniref:hypothetical protein n=1 Tax=Streptomyces fradiae TaxID=1906 RepID=UPI0036B64923